MKLKQREKGKRFEMDIGKEALAIDRRIRKKQVKVIKRMDFISVNN